MQMFIKWFELWIVMENDYKKQYVYIYIYILFTFIWVEY